MSTHNTPNTEASKPWYRQFWPWFLIALPATSVVVGLTMLGVSIINQDSLVQDDWYKDGKAINQSLARDTEATRLGISAELKIDVMTGDITVHTLDNGEFHPPSSLVLIFSHPTLAAQDQKIALSRQDGDGIYRGTLEHGLSGRYYIELSTTDWRLHSSREFPLDTLTLGHE